MKKSTKIYNLMQANFYVRAGATIVEVGKEWDGIKEKYLFWARFNSEEDVYIEAKKIWMENKRDR